MNKEGFLNRMTEKLSELLTPLAERMAQSKILSAISDAMTATLTILLMGSFVLLISQLDVGPWQSIVNSIPHLVTICNKINTVTMGMLALYVVVILAYMYSGKIELKERVVTSAVSAGVFLLITPFDEAGSLPSMVRNKRSSCSNDYWYHGS